MTSKIVGNKKARLSYAKIKNNFRRCLSSVDRVIRRAELFKTSVWLRASLQVKSDSINDVFYFFPLYPTLDIKNPYRKHRKDAEEKQKSCQQIRRTDDETKWDDGNGVFKIDARSSSGIRIVCKPHNQSNIKAAVSSSTRETLFDEWRHPQLMTHRLSAVLFETVINKNLYGGYVSILGICS